MIIAPEQLYPQGRLCSPDEVAEAWREAWNNLRNALHQMKPSKLFVMCGPPGSGKSTWARKGNVERNISVTFDACHACVTKRESIVAEARFHGVRPVCVWMRTPLEVCITRNATRPEWRRVPEHVICEQWQELETSPPEWCEGWDDILSIYP